MMLVISDIRRRYTIAEFERFISRPENQERRFELIDGKIVEKLRSDESSVIIAGLAMWVGTFVQKRGLGRIVHVAYRHALHDNYNDLLPDLSFTRRERLLPLVTEGAAQIPDLVIEIPSREDQFEEARHKVHYYLANGGQVVWLVNVVAHGIEVYTQNQTIPLTESDTLDGGGVCGAGLLPGFKLSVRSVFDID